MLDKCKIHDVFHIDRLKLCKTSDSKFKNRAKTLPTIDEPVYEVHKIIDERLIRGEIQYLVAWKDYSELFDSTWLTKSDLSDAAEVLTSWEARKK